MPGNELERWLYTRVAQVTGLPRETIDGSTSLDELGVNSVTKMGLVVEIERQTGQELDAELLYQCDTLGSLLEAVRVQRTR
jgi:acyl carrier protein